MEREKKAIFDWVDEMLKHKKVSADVHVVIKSFVGTEFDGAQNRLEGRAAYRVCGVVLNQIETAIKDSGVPGIEVDHSLMSEMLSERERTMKYDIPFGIKGAMSRISSRFHRCGSAQNVLAG